ncbi:MAG: trypsin-like peptidase domain-containing protein [Clostridia bacterium]|nr:trypsin-like peptidase domain-containing protein [Clostridia bacterium]
MSEFDNFNKNPAEGSNGDSFENNDAADQPRAEQNAENDGVVFNEDGTYHGRVRPEDNSRGNYQTADTENRSYPYGNSSGFYGNGQQYTGEGGSASENSGAGNSYPYGYSQPNGNNGSYPYGAPGHGNNGNSYPYGNTQQGRNDNGYPYGNNGEAPRYAYSDNGNGGNKKKNSSKIFAVVVSVLCVCLAIALIAVVAGDKKTPDNTEETTDVSVSENVEEFVTNASPVTGNVNMGGELTPKNIYNKVLPSSVGILVYDKSKALSSEGSGVLFQESADGKYTYIITCAHVISDSSGYIRVQTHDSKEYDAEVVGFDARTDIGVIRIEKTGFTLAEIGDSSKISVGDPIYAIGNPGGVEFANSFTDGIVSALDRPVNSSETGYTTECIQHTAAINPGNSGGALVNSFGQIIGINSMKIVADEYEGMGFAVPSSVFTEIVNEIMLHGYVSNRPKLGITYVAATEYSTYGMFVAIKGLPGGSIVIYEISSDSSLIGSEAKAGDMIVAVNGVGLDDPSYLSEVIEQSDVGDKLTLSLVRIHEDYSFDEFDVTVTLVEDRGDTFVTEEEPTTAGGYPGGYEDYFENYFEDFFGNYFGGGYNP